MHVQPHSVFGFKCTVNRRMQCAEAHASLCAPKRKRKFSTECPRVHVLSNREMLVFIKFVQRKAPKWCCFPTFSLSLAQNVLNVHKTTVQNRCFMEKKRGEGTKTSAISSFFYMDKFGWKSIVISASYIRWFFWSWQIQLFEPESVDGVSYHEKI